MDHHRHGLDAIRVRILTCTERPENPHALSTWLSPDDAECLFEACLSAPRPGRPGPGSTLTRAVRD